MISLPGSSQVCPILIDGQHPGWRDRDWTRGKVIVAAAPQVVTERRCVQVAACSSAQSLSRVRLFATPWTAARQASLSITSSRSPPRLMSKESVMPSNHLILCRPLLLLPSVFPSIRVFSNESALTTASGTQISNEQAPHTGSCMRVEKRFPFEIFGREDRYYQSNWRHRISSPGSELKYGDMEAPH